MVNALYLYLNKERSNAALVVFRMVFGLMMLYSTIRFISMGWVNSFYIMPKYLFPFEGFYWLKALPATGMYAVFMLMVLSSAFILLGFFYRISSIVFFLSFTYVELLDKSNYLNHYYFVSLMAFIIIFLPLHKRFSLDVYFNRVKAQHTTRNFYIVLPQFQLAIVYVYAGIAKINHDWLINALPLKIWLPAQSHIAIIGDLLTYEWVAYLFSWCGALYDLFIVFFLMNAKTRNVAYVFVIIFHVLTRILFPIGMFPFIMIASTLIFFSDHFHERIIKFFASIFPRKNNSILSIIPNVNTKVYYLFLVFMFIQLIVPFRYLAYPGNLFWTEQGYRFSWRVMLMEKAGTAIFQVEDSKTDKRIEVNNRDFLTVNQEKMMSTQPDMMVQYAHYLKEYYEQHGIVEPKVCADVFVSLNGSGSKRFIDSSIDLSKEKNNWKAKPWILEYEK